jgi:hypothetical protein
MDSNEHNEPVDRASKAKRPRKSFGELAKERATLAISLVALLLSGTTLYLTQLQNAVLTVKAADTLWIRYNGNDSDGNFEVHTLLVFQNVGSRPGVVRKVGLQIAPARAGGSVLLEAMYFEHIGVDYGFEPDVIAGPVAVGSKSTVALQINFITPYGDVTINPFPAAGRYDVTILFWDGEANTPKIGDTFTVEITDSERNYWRQQRDGQAGGECIKVVHNRWKQWQAGRRTRVAR